MCLCEMLFYRSSVCILLKYTNFISVVLNSTLMTLIVNVETNLYDIGTFIGIDIIGQIIYMGDISIAFTSFTDYLQ